MTKMTSRQFGHREKTIKPVAVPLGHVVAKYSAKSSPASFCFSRCVSEVPVECPT